MNTDLHPATVALVNSAPKLVTLASESPIVLDALMRFDRLAKTLPTLDAMSTDPKVASLVDARIRAEAATIRRLIDQAA